VHPSTPSAPLGRAKVNFYDTFLLCGEDLELELVVSDHVLKATTKKAGQLFWERKCTPDKMLATPMLPPPPPQPKTWLHLCSCWERGWLVDWRTGLTLQPGRNTRLWDRDFRRRSVNERSRNSNRNFMKLLQSHIDTTTRLWLPRPPPVRPLINFSVVLFL